MKSLAGTLNAKHVIRAVAAALACSILLLAQSGCGIPKLGLAKPAAPLPQSFNGETTLENSACVPTEEFFQDPILIGLIDQALFAMNFRRHCECLDFRLQLMGAE